MSLVSYPVTAGQEDFADAQSSGKNYIASAVITLTDLNLATVIMYDDAAASNGSTAKTTGTNGTKDIFIEPGDYILTVNSVSRNITVSSSQPIDVETLAELLAIKTTQVGQRLINREYANANYIVQESGYSLLTGDVTLTNGTKLKLQVDGDYLPEYFGAAGDKSTDDTASIQAAIDRATDDGGGNVIILKKYRHTSTLIINGGGVTVKGVAPVRVFTSEVLSSSSGVLYSDFTSGPAVLVADGGCAVTDLTIEGSATRRAAGITTGSRNSNSGIIVEPFDDATDLIQSVKIENVFCISHPADGFLIEGDVTNITMKNCYSSDTGRHGKAITEGDIGGRTNKDLPGIIVIEKGKSFDAGGHGLCIGHPNSSSFPYRVTVVNVEGYRLALDAGERYSTAANFIVGQDVTMINCAFGGTGAGNTPDHEGLEIGGRDITLLDSRFIASGGATYVIFRQQAGFSAKNIKIDGGICSTAGATPPPDFALIPAGPDGITIKRVDFDGANSIDTIAVGATNNDVILHDVDANKTVHHNHTQDYTGATVVGLRSTGVSQTTIVSGAITAEKEGYYNLDTEGDAATDTLTTINGGTSGDVIILSQSNSGRVITLDHGPGNIRLSGAVDYQFPSTAAFIQLMYNGANWHQVAPAVNNS